MRRFTQAVLMAVVASGGASAEDGSAALAGRWDAVVTVSGVEVPFPFEIVVQRGLVSGSFFNGERRITSRSGRFDSGVLTLAFDQYATTLKATLADGRLTGEYQRPRGPYPFRASKAVARPASADTPSIAGTWIVSAKSNKGETAWRFLVQQRGGVVNATILRVDGDTGTLSGSYRDGRFVLSHFSGARPLLLEVTPRADGTLTLTQNAKTELVAAREGDARAVSFGAPTDPAHHTSVKDPNEPLRFSFPDLQGRIVSNTDPKFAGKVVLVNISGSWCPNCHDEAPFLSALYRKYRDKGLEIVALSFEEGDQLTNPTRLRAFIETYGIEYTVLIPGEPDDLEAKIPQAVNLNAFPTTFVVGRDGRVRAVHAGFPSPGSGEYYSKAEREMTAEVERLLAERGSR
ncbi:MAG: TlpA family protein disulfide reductase [Acidobacteriota bacterium]